MLTVTPGGPDSAPDVVTTVNGLVVVVPAVAAGDDTGTVVGDAAAGDTIGAPAVDPGVVVVVDGAVSASVAVGPALTGFTVDPTGNTSASVSGVVGGAPTAVTVVVVGGRVVATVAGETVAVVVVVVAAATDVGVVEVVSTSGWVVVVEGAVVVVGGRWGGVGGLELVVDGGGGTCETTAAVACGNAPTSQADAVAMPAVSAMRTVSPVAVRPLNPCCSPSDSSDSSRQTVPHHGPWPP